MFFQEFQNFFSFEVGIEYQQSYCEYQFGFRQIQFVYSKVVDGIENCYY